MKVAEFIKSYEEKQIANSKTSSEYIKKMLEVKEYIPFIEKRTLVEAIVKEHITEVDGIKKYDAIAQYLSFIVAMIENHTNIEFENKYDDYDALAKHELLMPIISTFQADYNDCEVLLKMALASELEDNNVNVIVSKFLNGILARLDTVGEVVKSIIGDADIKDIFGANFNENDLAQLKGFLDRYN